MAVIAAILHGQDKDGIDLYFTSSKQKYDNRVDPKDFVDMINAMNPEKRKASSAMSSGSSSSHGAHDPADDIRDVLGHILGSVRPDKKLTLLIFTDGIWRGISRKRTVAENITQVLHSWQDKPAMNQLLNSEIRGLSIQFIQFGDDEAAAVEFDYMDNRLTNSDMERMP